MTKNLPTIWEVPDALWSIIEPILNRVQLLSSTIVIIE